jgi:hypothetical protein
MTRLSLFAVAVAALLIGAVMAQTGSSSTSAPSTTFWTLTVGEDAPKRADEAVVDLHNPKTVTVCGDVSTKRTEVSIDGKHWYHLSTEGGCVQAPPVRFVKLAKEGNENSNIEVYATY